MMSRRHGDARMRREKDAIDAAGLFDGDGSKRRSAPLSDSNRSMLTLMTLLFVIVMLLRIWWLMPSAQQQRECVARNDSVQSSPIDIREDVPVRVEHDVPTETTRHVAVAERTERAAVDMAGPLVLHEPEVSGRGAEKRMCVQWPYRLPFRPTRYCRDAAVLDAIRTSPLQVTSYKPNDERVEPFERSDGYWRRFVAAVSKVDNDTEVNPPDVKAVEFDWSEKSEALATLDCASEYPNHTPGAVKSFIRTDLREYYCARDAHASKLHVDNHGLRHLDAFDVPSRFHCIPSMRSYPCFDICIFPMDEDIYVSSSTLVGGIYVAVRWVNSVLNLLRRIRMRKAWPETKYQLERFFQNEKKLGFLGELEGMAVIDVGANVGTVSLWLAIHGLTVYAFEPNDQNVALLRESARRNNLLLDTGNFMLFPEGADSKSGERTLYVHKYNKGAHTLRPPEKNFANWTETSIRMARVDDRVPEWERIAFMKIDVEGFEGCAVEGARRTIERGIPIIALELWGAHKEGCMKPEEIVEYFDNLNYTFYFTVYEFLEDRVGNIKLPPEIKHLFKFPLVDYFIVRYDLLIELGVVEKHPLADKEEIKEFIEEL